MSGLDLNVSVKVKANVNFYKDTNENKFYRRPENLQNLYILIIRVIL